MKKMWKWKKKCGTEVETWAQPQDCAEKPLQATPDQSGRQLRKMKAGMIAWAQSCTKYIQLGENYLVVPFNLC